MVNNLNDGLAWGIFPLYFAACGLSWTHRRARGPLPGGVGPRPAVTGAFRIGSAVSG